MPLNESPYSDHGHRANEIRFISSNECTRYALACFSQNIDRHGISESFHARSRYDLPLFFFRCRSSTCLETVLATFLFVRLGKESKCNDFCLSPHINLAPAPPDDLDHTSQTFILILDETLPWAATNWKVRRNKAKHYEKYMRSLHTRYSFDRALCKYAQNIKRSKIIAKCSRYRC